MGVTTKVPGIEGDEELSQVMGEFDRWRAQRRSKKERIPEQLWQRAASLATRHGVNRVAALLHLAGGGLGRRVALARGGQEPVQARSNAPQFVEMLTPACATVPLIAGEPERTECVVEMVNLPGTKMRVELRGAGLAGLSALCQAFCAAR